MKTFKIIYYEYKIKNLIIELNNLNNLNNLIITNNIRIKEIENEIKYLVLLLNINLKKL
jgi:hypothetical protein